MRKALAEEEEEKTKETQGQCKCAKCGAIIKGSSEPCVEGALCIKCALKNKPVSSDVKSEKDAKKSAADAGMAPGSNTESISVGLRKRGYLA